ncbi:MAG TPA: hypothetical protein DHV53_02465 [Gammaproteobacteria bacterium]|nr:hypothetical protein [Gammaproteobacteria bacterium]OUX34761.1 MAG: hypothetical protein CBE20_00745 [Gammaproteobacteria bacterium TMED260]HBQ01903.1 hypothetical protein [Gammaproteobacteria bacterium]HCA36548.1 hypothetical protein [Gammaproteobacteria bacterium]HCI87489.1 hypothetical protein [Gammaproteobacteria bacterium]|tara:strand:- start:512 stop:1084 length:573 start_codon:yes stop_codon:yes gene_type:complete
MRIGALLLAAGFSSRFGGVKLLAALDSGTRVFDQTFARLQAAVPETVVLTRPELSSELDATARRVEVFSEAERGMGATLAFGMQFTGGWDACMICLSDMPFIASDTYRTLAEQATSDSILLPECDGETGNPVVFGSAFFSELGKLSGDAGGKVLIRQHPDKVIKLKLQDRAILMDIDTPQDLAQLQASQT